MVVTTRDVEIASTPAVRHIMLMSDLHLGSAFADVDAIKQDLETARRHDARIILNGDVFDAIVPSDKKRYSPTALIPELRNRADVLNASVEYAKKLLEPYKDLIDVIGVGNHETASEKYHAVDPVSILLYALGGEAKHGGYCGYYVLRGRYAKSIRQIWTLKLRYHHGSGGASPVTKGITDFQRMRAWISDADVITVGHKHNKMAVPDVRERLTNSGRVVYEPLLCLMTGSYLDTYRQQENILAEGRQANYAADWNVSPQPKGGILLECTFNTAGQSESNNRHTPAVRAVIQ